MGQTASKLAIPKSVVLRDEDMVCFDRETGCVLRLNESAYAILLHFAEPRHVNDVFESVSQIFNISVPEASAWVESIAGYLIEHNVLKLESTR